MPSSEFDVAAIDVVVNPMTPEIMAIRPDWAQNFFVGKIGREKDEALGVTAERTIELMDEAGIERAFMVATRTGRLGLPGSWHLPYEMVAALVAAHPDRFSGLAGVDPTMGMQALRDLEFAVRELGFIGAHSYPHWFEMAPDDPRYYPVYAKCVELDIPIQLQVGQSLIYTPEQRLRSTARPISLDPVACHFPELRLIGIHIGIPWADEMIAMAWKHENVFIGSDAHSPRYWPANFVHFLDSYGRDKVLFGTDFPVLDFRRTREEFDALGLRPETRRKVLRDNAERVYRLDGNP